MNKAMDDNGLCPSVVTLSSGKFMCSKRVLLVQA